VRKKRLLVLLGSVCLALMLVVPLLAACAPAAPEAPTEMTLKLGTGPVGGNWFPLGAVLSTLINEKVEGVRAAPTLGGGTSNMKALNEGTMDIGLTIGMTNAQAWAGDPPFEKQWRDARSMFNTYINTIHAYSLAESGIKTVEDTVGKRVTPGKMGYTGEVMWRLILEEYGLSWEDDFESVVMVGYDEGATLMKDKHLDVYFILTFAPSAPFLELDAFSPIEVFAPSTEIQDIMIDKYPGFGKTIVPGGIYKNLPNDLTTIGSPCVWACRKGLPEDVVYRITKTFWEEENYQRNWACNPGFSKFILPENALVGLALPLHPGAYKYYKEKGYDIPEKIMPID
jgi:TRAP transporter TAXI family solute receptor